MRSGPGAARTILLFLIISARPSKPPQKIPRGFGWRIDCGVEVTEKEEDAMQVNKTLAHNLSLTLLGGEPVSRVEKGARILKSFVCLVK